ncbi:MAG: hypothetical protein LBF41_09950, partial [Deltaproteobacteria bacterium]|nr:hypothetical protein [Deltaproteobacteria bacterium]
MPKIFVRVPSPDQYVHIRVSPPSSVMDIKIGSDGEFLELKISPKGREIQVRVLPEEDADNDEDLPAGSGGKLKPPGAAGGPGPDAEAPSVSGKDPTPLSGLTQASPGEAVEEAPGEEAREEAAAEEAAVAEVASESARVTLEKASEEISEETAEEAPEEREEERAGETAETEEIEEPREEEDGTEAPATSTAGTVEAVGTIEPVETAETLETIGEVEEAAEAAEPEEVEAVEEAEETEEVVEEETEEPVEFLSGDSGDLSEGKAGTTFLDVELPDLSGESINLERSEIRGLSEGLSDPAGGTEVSLVLTEPAASFAEEKGKDRIGVYPSEKRFPQPQVIPKPVDPLTGEPVPEEDSSFPLATAPLAEEESPGAESSTREKGKALVKALADESGVELSLFKNLDKLISVDSPEIEAKILESLSVDEQNDMEELREADEFSETDDSDGSHASDLNYDFLGVTKDGKDNVLEIPENPEPSGIKALDMADGENPWGSNPVAEAMASLNALEEENRRRVKTPGGNGSAIDSGASPDDEVDLPDEGDDMDADEDAADDLDYDEEGGAGDPGDLPDDGPDPVLSFNSASELSAAIKTLAPEPELAVGDDVYADPADVSDEEPDEEPAEEPAVETAQGPDTKPFRAKGYEVELGDDEDADADSAEDLRHDLYDEGDDDREALSGADPGSETDSVADQDTETGDADGEADGEEDNEADGETEDEPDEEDTFTVEKGILRPNGSAPTNGSVLPDLEGKSPGSAEESLAANEAESPAGEELSERDGEPEGEPGAETE